MPPECCIPSSPLPMEWRRVVTVTGALAPEELGITDAHNHVWIAPPAGANAAVPRLDDLDAALEELRHYRRMGGRALLDCQPGLCGRDARALVRLTQASRVRIVACTGFHLRRYYSPNEPLWRMNAQLAGDWFAGELLHGMRETLGKTGQDPAPAGFIKAACESTLEESNLALLEAAAQAARQTGAAVLVHTEAGADVEAILGFFIGQGLTAHKLVLCHMDKRPDFGLHCELAAEGALLAYDTFFREQYAPKVNLWPLLERMIKAGHAGSLALATDMARIEMWQVRGGPGLASLPGAIQGRLKSMGVDSATIQMLLGGNITQRIARVT